MVPTYPNQHHTRTITTTNHLAMIRTILCTYQKFNQQCYLIFKLTLINGQPLIYSIQSHKIIPKLARGMNDPRYMAALQCMQTNPKETLERLKETSPDIVDWLMEFCIVMGEHFIKLGGEESCEGSKDAHVPPGIIGAEKIREMGPLEKKALEKHHQEKENNKQKKQAAK